MPMMLRQGNGVEFYTGNTTETAMGTYATWSQAVLAEDKIYFTTSEHTSPNPIPRGHHLYCVNAKTGELIWSIPMEGEAEAS